MADLNKSDVLESITFGQRVAEQETEELGSYFVETIAWKSIYAGDVDVVYGPKGAGKSALYSLLRDREGALQARGIVLISAENPSGAPVFRDLVAEPPASTTEFRSAQPVLRITFREPTAADRRLGHVSADELLELANSALQAITVRAWVLFDRLDVAFSESAELEANALSALFRVYLDVQHLQHLSLKIFLRNDIWERVFPPKVDLGARRPATFVWMLLRTQDGTQHNAPRELIHLLSAARDVQRRKLQEGQKDPPGEALFDRSAIRDALPEVSRERLEQTLYAEYPHLRRWLMRLKRERTEQSYDSLARIWDVERDTAMQMADELVQVGFFEERGAQRDPTLWVPFLYRDALEMVEGAAD